MIRIAMFTQGGIARPGTTGYIPSIVELVDRLSRKFDISVFGTSSQVGDTGGFLCGNASVLLTRATFRDPFVTKVLSLARAFAEAHRKKPFDLVHGQWSIPGGLVAVLVGKFFGIPSVVSVLGADAAAVSQIGYGHLLKTPTRLVTMWTLRRAGVVTSLTEFQARQLKQHGLDRTDVHVIPTGVDTSHFSPGEQKHTRPPFRLLHVANLTPVKNQQLLLQSFELISREVDATLSIVGPDYLNGEIQRLAESLGLAKKVHFVGRVDHHLLPEHYRKADLLLQSSYYEGQGLVIAEAAACGTVPCGTRVGLISDLEDTCTVASGLNDPRELAKKALDLLNDTTRLKELERAGLQWAREHDIDWTARKLGEVYEGLVHTPEHFPEAIVNMPH